MRVIVLFAGQGYTNEDLYDLLLTDEQGRAWLNDYQQVNDFDCLEMVHNLHKSKYTQLLISAYQLSLFSLLKPLLSACDVTLAGYSLGEVSAFLASVDADVQTSYQCVHKRTKLMRQLIRQDKSDRFDVVAIQGHFDQSQIEQLCKKHRCGIAIINADNHYVIGGKVGDLKKLLAQAENIHIDRQKWLEIDIPSHTPYYLSTVPKLFKYLKKQFSEHQMNYPIINPVSLRKVFNTQAEIELLSQELCQTLHWHTVCKMIPEFGYDLIIDLGPGKSMTSLYQSIDSHAVSVITCANFKTLQGLKTHLQKTLSQ